MYTQQMQGSLLAFFYPCLVSALFSGPSLLEMKFCRNSFSPIVSVLFGGFLNQPPNKRWTCFCARDEHFWCWRWAYFTLEMNTLVLETNVLKTRVQTSVTHTKLATSNFQTNLMLRWLLLIGTHFRKQAVSRSRSHLRVCYTHKLYNGIYVCVCNNSIQCWPNGFQVG